jgi:hypothetical protein
MVEIIKILQPFIVLSMLLIMIWAAYRTVIKKDEAAGAVLYLSLVVIVDNYLRFSIALPGFSTGSVRYSEIWFLILITRIYKSKTNRIEGRLRYYVVGYFILFAIAAFRGITLFDGLFNFREIFIYQILAFMIGLKNSDNYKFYETFNFYLAIFMIYAGLIVFWDKFYDINLIWSANLNSGVYDVAKKYDRHGSFFLNPNMYGAFIVLSFFSIVACFITIEGKIKRFVLSFGILFALFSLILTRSRGPQLGFAISTIIFFVQPGSYISRIKKISIFVSVLLTLFILMPGFFETATTRFTEEQINQETSVANLSRGVVWENTANLIVKFPLFGIGLGEEQYKLHMQREYDFVRFFGHLLDNPHNSYLQIGVMAGIIALIFFLKINQIIISKGIRFGIIKKKYVESMIFIGIVPGMIGYLVAIVFDMGMFTNVTVLYWVITGLCCSVIEKSEKDLSTR